MANSHPRTLIGNKFSELIIPDHNVKPKWKAQAGFVRKSAVLCPIIYLYHGEVSRYYLME